MNQEILNFIDKYIKEIKDNSAAMFIGAGFSKSAGYVDWKNLLNNNRFNQNPPKYSCDVCKTVNSLTGSYIAYVEEETFLKNPDKYINNAYDKSENDAAGYKLTKTR